MPTPAEKLLGAWVLVSWRVVDTNATSEPFGADPVGLLTYAPQGWMQASLATADRPGLSSVSPRQAPDDELATAYRSFFSYAGPYEVREREGIVDVVHHVTIALNPSMVGTEQVRRVDLVDGKLTLSADEPIGGGRVRRHALHWRRP